MVMWVIGFTPHGRPFSAQKTGVTNALVYNLVQGIMHIKDPMLLSERVVH